MTSEWIDISMPLSTGMVVWPGHEPPSLVHNREFEDGFRSINSTFTTNTHVGTHVDAPLHFIPGGETVDQLELDVLIGTATVVDIGHTDRVTAETLEKTVPSHTERLLLRTDNSRRHSTIFDPEFVALTSDASQWIVDHDIKMVGIDYLSIALYKGATETHTTLLHAGIPIVEGLVLRHVDPGDYEFVCLPLLIKDGEGAPARAVLRRRT